MATLSNGGGSTWKAFTPISSALANLPNGAGTMVALVNLAGLTYGHDFCGLVNAVSITNWYHSNVMDASGYQRDDDGIVWVVGPAARAVTNAWMWYGVTWPSGSAALERFHYRNQTTQAAWSHENSTGNNGGNRAGPGTGGHFRIGYVSDYGQDGCYFGLVAVWAGVQFADSDFGAWTKTSDLWNHARGTPTFLCECTSTTPVDLVGGSTYSSSNSSGMTLTGGNPDNWTYDQTGPSNQIVRPDGDMVTTGWSTAPLYSKINDQSDSTVITATLA